MIGHSSRLNSVHSTNINPGIRGQHSGRKGMFSFCERGCRHPQLTPSRQPEKAAFKASNEVECKRNPCAFRPLSRHIPFQKGQLAARRSLIAEPCPEMLIVDCVSSKHKSPSKSTSKMMRVGLGKVRPQLLGTGVLTPEDNVVLAGTTTDPSMSTASLLQFIMRLNIPTLDTSAFPPSRPILTNIERETP